MECGGNSAPLYSKEPVQANVQALHGLCSCAEWTGVKLSTLLEEAGVDASAKWFIAEGADSPTMNRSVPLAKAMDDAMIALYQNGERLNPSNGYPMRLLLPGYEGNMNVKWLRRIKLVESPVMAINETKQYTILRPDGKAWQFYFPQEVKSFITHPSPGLIMKGPGFYEISGISFSGNGRISKVEVSADGGKSWAQAALQEPVLSKAFTRFRVPWNWDGGPVILQSRATDEAGNMQPTREAFIAERGHPGVHPIGIVHHGALQRHHELGDRCQGRGQPCLRLRYCLGRGACLVLNAAVAADAPRLGQPMSAADLAPWDISIKPDGVGCRRAAGPPRRVISISELLARLPWRKGRGGPSVVVGGSQLIGMTRAGKADRKFLALRDDDFRLHPACHAVATAKDAQRQRSLCPDRLYTCEQQDHRRNRCDECRDAAESANAQSGWFHQQVPGET